MKKCLFTLLTALFAVSCSDLKREIRPGGGEENAVNLPEFKTSDYLENVDCYVNCIKENAEKLQFVRSNSKDGKTVYGILENDTVRISVLGDSLKEDIDIYYKDSKPILLTREVILDVDSDYMETAYFKDDEIYKCFKNGEELTDKDSLKMFSAIIDNIKKL